MCVVQMGALPLASGRLGVAARGQRIRVDLVKHIGQAEGARLVLNVIHGRRRVADRFDREWSVRVGAIEPVAVTCHLCSRAEAEADRARG